MIKIAVCDDEEIYLRKITDLLERLLDHHGIDAYGIDTYLSGHDLLCNMCSDRQPGYDVIFLDVNMPGESGMEVAAKIRESSSDVLLVFITMFVDYATEGYKVEATRFLPKEMLEATLPECIETILKKLSLQTHKLHLCFLEGERDVAVDSICYVESQLHKLLFHMVGQKKVQYSLYGKLDDFQNELLQYGFIRVHKSFLVNSRYIENIANYRVYLKNRDTIPIPREKNQMVKERYYEIMGEMI